MQHPLAVRRLSPAVLPTALLAALLSPDATGHGGQYTQPRVPLGPVTGVDPADAGRFSGPSGAPPTSLGPSGVLRRAAEDGGGWRAWWRAQGPSLLAARAGDRSGGMASLSGRAREAAAEWEPLRTLLSDALKDSEIDVVDSALLARGRSASAARADQAFQEIWPFVGHPAESIRRSAIAALGLLPSERVVPVLVSLIGQPRQTDPITNGIAALALGYQSAPEGIPALERVIERRGAPETVAAAVVALGLYRESRREIVLFLVGLLGDETLPEIARAQVPIALGRLGEDATPAVPRLEELAARGDLAVERRAAIVALGALILPEDDEATRRLVERADRERDVESRGAALLALGEVAARAGGDPEAAGATRARAHLVQRLVAPMNRADLGFTCLAAARAVEALDRRDEARVAVVERLERLLHDRRSDASADAARGAAAVALALLDHVEVVVDLRERAEATDDPRLRADLAQALGLLEDDGALPLLRRFVEESPHRRVREVSIEALGRISRDVAGTVLTRQLDEAVLPEDRILFVQGLARVGGPSEMPHLLRLAQNQEIDVLTRAFAVVALGRLLEPGALPWNERLAAGADPGAQCAAVRELLDLF